MAKISRNPLPTEPVDTLEPLVVTTAPTENNGNNIESLGKVSKLLRKVLKGYNELYKNKTENLTFVRHLNKVSLCYRSVACTVVSRTCWEISGPLKNLITPEILLPQRSMDILGIVQLDMKLLSISPIFKLFKNSNFLFSGIDEIECEDNAT